MNSKASSFQLVALLAGGCIGVLIAAVVANVLGIPVLGAIFAYGSGLLALPMAALVVFGVLERR